KTSETEAQLGELASESHRLAESVQALAAEREQVLTRLAAIERGLDDVTGAIKREPAATPPRGSAQPAVSPSPTPSAGASASEQRVLPTPIPAAPRGPPDAPVIAIPDDAARGASASPGPAHPAASEPVSTAPGLGIDIGGAVNFDGLRTLWASVKHGV